jgi:5'-nucleotidase
VSLNVPDRPLAEVRGVRSATLAPFLERWSAEARAGEVLLEYTGRDEEPPPGSDLALVLEGYTAVTVLGGITPADGDGAAPAIEAATRA